MTEQNDKETECYSTEVQCINCKKNKFFYPPKGASIVEYLEGKVCEDCGCKMVIEKRGSHHG